MFAFISTIIIIWLVMWLFFKFMYPKPPKHYFPQEGDVIEPRNCDYCGHSLEEYRGVLESKPAGQTGEAKDSEGITMEAEEREWFFCNYEHQASFHAERGEKTKQDVKPHPENPQSAP